MRNEKIGQEETYKKKPACNRDKSPIWGTKTGKRRGMKFCEFGLLNNVVIFL
jgi:hypothetical protein